MSDLTDYAEKLLLDWLLTAGAVTRPTAWYVALHTADPGEAGDANEVLVADDADYARQSVTFGAATLGTGQAASTAQVAHTPAVGAAAYQVTHISICDAASNGNHLFKGALAAPRTIDNANPLLLNAGDILAALA